MNKFWPAVLLLVILAGGLLYLENQNLQSSRINFTDLETECRMGPEAANIAVTEDDSLRFSGNYPESNTRSELSYRYRQTEDRIVLDVRSESPGVPETFVDDCLASVVYKAETATIDPGRYLVEVRHDGETERKVVIRIS